MDEFVIYQKRSWKPGLGLVFDGFSIMYDMISWGNDTTESGLSYDGNEFFFLSEFRIIAYVIQHD